MEDPGFRKHKGINLFTRGQGRGTITRALVRVLYLDRYAEGLQEGSYLRRGDPIGYVGTTGNAPPNTPHLHFAIFELGPEKRWWEGTPVNPYPFLMKVK